MIVRCDLCGEVVFDGVLHHYDRAHNPTDDVADADARVTTYQRDNAFYFEIRDSNGVGLDAGMHNHAHDG